MNKNIINFLNDYYLLCEQYGLHLECEDPFCGLELCEMDEDCVDRLYRKYSDNEKSNN